MSATSNRSTEVDFFRGLSLLVIMLDHIPFSLLSNVTLHHYAFCDAAEIFVFVGGYSVAAAFTAIQARQGTNAASQRFFRRAWEIYRAFLITAALMLALGVLFQALSLNTPVVGATEARTFLRRPLGMLLDVLTLRRQPFLSSVLPMYALFALAAPFILRLARHRPGVVLAGSVAIWAFAPHLAVVLPTAYEEGWAFNPFAWQIMFVTGALTRMHPVSDAFFRSASGKWLTRLAVLVAVTCGLVVLFVVPQGLPGYEKQNISLLRLIDFAALAWTAAAFSVGGRVSRFAAKMPTLVRIGQQSLACFIGGAVISVIIGTLLRPQALAHWLPVSLLPMGFLDMLQNRPMWEYGALADVLAIAALCIVGTVAGRYKTRMKAREKSRQQAGASLV